jgi:hypothetical protein
VFKIKRGRRLIAQSIGVAVAAGSLALVFAATGSAAPTPPFGSPYSVTLLQQTQGETPITATGFTTGECLGVPGTQDGWHFILPGDFTGFLSISLTFSSGSILTGPTFFNGGTQVAAGLGKEAVVGTTPGAVLTGGTAMVQTELGKDQVTFFTLSNTCPASPTSPSPPPSGSPPPSSSPSPSGSPSPGGSPSTPPGAPPPTPVHTNLPVTG